MLLFLHFVSSKNVFLVTIKAAICFVGVGMNVFT